MFAVDARGRKDTNWIGTGRVAGGAFGAKDFTALFSHANIIQCKASGQDPTVNIAVCVSEKKDLLASCDPQGNLGPNMINQDGAGATKVSDGPEIPSMLIVYGHPALFVVIHRHLRSVRNI
jgi:hypothetical protein